MSNQDSGLAWSNITYDIPLPKQKRKEASAAEKGGGDLEKQEGLKEAKPSAADGGPKVGDRRILDGVSGGVKRGEMTAILGASGGKYNELPGQREDQMFQHARR